MGNALAVAAVGPCGLGVPTHYGYAPAQPRKMGRVQVSLAATPLNKDSYNLRCHGAEGYGEHSDGGELTYCTVHVVYLCFSVACFS